MEKQYDYNFFKNLFDLGWNGDNGWKSIYFNETQKCFEKHFKLLGLWCQHPEDPTKFGIIINNKWSWMNRINTHPNCCLFFYRWCLEEDENFFIELGNPKYHSHNIRKMWKFLDENFEKFFTTNITNKYHNTLLNKCEQSWFNGNLSTIAVIISLKECFIGSKNYSYTFEQGDTKDMGGVDVSFTTENDEIKTIQVKSGQFEDWKSEFYVSGSQNDLTYSTDYYSYSSVGDNFTWVIFFKNDLSGLKKDENNKIEIQNELVLYHKRESMSLPQKLKELFEMSVKNNKSFSLTMEGENNVTIDDDQVIVIISNLEDENLENLLDEKIKELQ